MLALLPAAPAPAQVAGEASPPPVLAAEQAASPPPTPPPQESARPPAGEAPRLEWAHGSPGFVAVELLVGVGFAPHRLLLSADLGFRYGALRLRYHGQVNGSENEDWYETSNGARADWIFAEREDYQLAGFVGGGLGTLVRNEDPLPTSRGAMAVLEVGLIVGSRLVLTPLTVGLEVQVPLSGSTGSTPFLAVTLSVNPLFFLGR